MLPIPIYCDSESSIAISYDLIHQSKMHDIERRYHFLNDHILKGSIKFVFVTSREEIVDVFTKALDTTKLYGFLEMLGMMNPDPQFFLNG